MSLFDPNRGQSVAQWKTIDIYVEIFECSFNFQSSCYVVTVSLLYNVLTSFYFFDQKETPWDLVCGNPQI